MHVKSSLALVAIACCATSLASAEDVRIVSPVVSPVTGSTFDVAVAIQGKLLLVGAPNSDTNQAGVVRIYRRISEQNCQAQLCWQFAGTLSRPNSFAGDNFGADVVIDGNTVLVGSYAAGSPATERAVFAYELTGSDELVLRQTLTPTCTAPCTAINFGRHIALAGNRAAVTESSSGQRGAVSIYGRDVNGVWQFETRIEQVGGTVIDRFGTAVAVTENNVVVGGPGFGYAKSYVKQNGLWLEEQTLTPWDATFGDFGGGVALDGSLLVVGAQSVNVGSECCIGAAYVFDRGSGGFGAVDKLVRFDGTSFEQFGSDVVIDAGRIAVAGRKGIYLFAQSNGIWETDAKLLLDAASLSGAHHLIAMDGTTLVAAADNGVYLYDLSAPAAGSNVVIEAENMYFDGGYSVEPGFGRIVIADTANNPTGYAFAEFTGASRTYRVEVELVGGGTDLSVVEFYLNGERLDYLYFDYEESPANPKLILPSVSMATGDGVVLAGWAEGNGGARVDKIVFVPQ